MLDCSTKYSHTFEESPQLPPCFSKSDKTEASILYDLICLIRSVLLIVRRPLQDLKEFEELVLLGKYFLFF